MLNKGLWTSIAVLCLACIALSGCLFLPGRFNAKLDVARDGNFAFCNAGEMVFLMPEEEAQEWNDAFAECHAETDGQWTRRPCTSAELAKEKAFFEAQKVETAKAAEALKDLIGFNPTNPAANRALGEELERRPGWKKVEYLGRGRFYVEYETKGEFDRDFAFPIIPQAQLAMPFVHISRAEGDRVEVRGAGLASPQLRQLLKGTGPQDPSRYAGQDLQSDFADVARGTFTVTTTAEVISANGTESSDGDTKQLVWVLHGEARETPMLDLEFGS